MKNDRCITIPERIVTYFINNIPFHISRREANVIINEIKGSIIKKDLKTSLTLVKYSRPPVIKKITAIENR